MKIGDILIDKNGCKHKVLGKRGKYWLLSYHNNFNREGHLWTYQEIIERGNKLLNKE